MSEKLTVEEWLKSIGFDTVETIQAVPSEWDEAREKAHKRMREIMDSPDYIELRNHVAMRMEEEASGNTLANALCRANNYVRDA